MVPPRHLLPTDKAEAERHFGQEAELLHSPHHPRRAQCLCAHAKIHHENGRCILYDRGSTNGTFVNGRRISGANMIKVGWRLRLGNVELIVREFA
jgi:hypothetical protein